mgnify:CR=1 FL=1
MWRAQVDEEVFFGFRSKLKVGERFTHHRQPSLYLPPWYPRAPRLHPPALRGIQVSARGPNHSPCTHSTHLVHGMSGCRLRRLQLPPRTSRAWSVSRSHNHTTHMRHMRWVIGQHAYWSLRSTVDAMRTHALGAGLVPRPRPLHSPRRRGRLLRCARCARAPRAAQWFFQCW